MGVVRESGREGRRERERRGESGRAAPNIGESSWRLRGVFGRRKHALPRHFTRSPSFELVCDTRPSVSDHSQSWYDSLLLNSSTFAGHVQPPEAMCSHTPLDFVLGCVRREGVRGPGTPNSPTLRSAGPMRTSRLALEYHGDPPSLPPNLVLPIARLPGPRDI
ncbi:hypothetical protein GY45DRAFT_739885 [Cubamyces sp. BRFM 1775]|nr:hypothetical protein GY45DRAFT_739885 [Cubamyces sp. BRFM 1775]